MLPLVPILLLANAALYAFALPVPSPPNALSGPVADNTPSNMESTQTVVVGELGMSGKGVLDPHGVISLVTGEGQGHFHPVYVP